MMIRASIEQFLHVSDDTYVPCGKQYCTILLDRETIIDEPLDCSKLIIARYPDLDQLFTLYDRLPPVIECDIPNPTISGPGKRLQNFAFSGKAHLKNFRDINSISGNDGCEIILENAPCYFINCEGVINKLQLDDFPGQVKVGAAGVNEIIGKQKVKLTLRGNINHQNYVKVEDLHIHLSEDHTRDIGVDAINNPHLDIYAPNGGDLSDLNLNNVTTLVISGGEVKLGDMAKLISWTSPCLTKYPMPYCPKLRFINVEMHWSQYRKGTSVEQLVLDHGELYHEGTSRPKLRFNVVYNGKKILFDHTQILDIIPQAQTKSARNV